MIRYSISTWQDTYNKRWYFIIRKAMRVTFKRSKREGWRGLGFVALTMEPSPGFDTRPEALAAGKAAKSQLEAR